MEPAAQYQTFRLGEEVFAPDITQVRELLDYTAITRVPRMPEFMRGVINLRGSMVPVADLQLKFGMSKRDEHFVIILDVDRLLSNDELSLVQGASVRLRNK